MTVLLEAGALRRLQHPTDPNFSPAGPCSKECFGPSSVRVAPAVSMFPRQNPACLCALGAVFLLVSGEEVSESRSGMIQELRSALADLAGEGKTYLGRLAGEQTVLSVQKAFSQVLGVVAEGLASGLNVLLQHVSHLLQAAGVQVVFPINRVTPEGLLFLAQWVLVALIGYWLVSFAFCLVASTLRRAVWLLKVGVALACFGFILRDHSVGTETMAVRLAVLVCACVLLGVGTSKGPDAADKTAHLEEQVRILERRLREMEKWTKAE
ncbi:putative transmembrane protein 109 [Scophthalmus maximus]|uniref:Putative transmembrane protein 109 n=1 Tax=Scophthalmus maximus TaxID=52904 RepID=A0A2U9BRY9_SCOMX|nr:putative transmembrane protein 109 [Scophthalmus maximus]